MAKKFLAQDLFQKRALIRLVYAKDQISDQIGILGIDYEERKCQDDASTGMQRCEQAMKCAEGLARLPLATQHRKSLWRTRIIPLAAWGWWCEVFPSIKQRQFYALCRKVAYLQKMGSVHWGALQRIQK